MKIYLATNYKTVNPVREAIESISGRLNLQLYRADYLNIEEQIVPQIIETIKKSDIVIADISNENPNIYYEVGIAHSLDKPVILVSQTDNFNRFSLLSYRFYKYDINPTGIRNLAFRLEQILSSPNEIEELKPIQPTRQVLTFKEFSGNIQLQNILQLNGARRGYEFEQWVFELLRDIPNLEVEHGVKRKDGEYDFIVWNSNSDKELESLGNPIPIEAKATIKIGNDLLYSLASKASLQGFKSFVLITTAEISYSNERLIQSLKTNTGVSILVIGFNELQNINTSKDLYWAIKKSFREYFIS
ncbi:MAG TPA: hypothetical protein DEO70_12325 [Bacteroidales bacterium]|nr:MAG: hypothetical protein A2X11_13045 [Bacteroidetes bacterium GWE2_42_24]OFY25335.1 MAG: hypothetical protein A2X09_10250 [Bacteroidetes bacterium GWF2_43_11]HBZ67615.1 hypothetical protein [Bacteroidales bacterium]